MADQDQAGFAILRRLKSMDLPLWLTPNPSLSNDARKASVHLFSSLNPHCPKSPFDQLLIDGFDAEQIWQQINLQSQPLLSTVKREVRRLEKSPEQVSKFFRVKEGNGGEKKEVVNGDVHESENLDGFGGDDDDVDGDTDVDMEDLEELDEEDDDDEGRESEESGGERESKKVGVEDEFLKIKELEKYMKEDEAREYGLEEAGKKKNEKEKKKKSEVEDSDDEEEDDDDDDDDEDEDEEEDEDDEVTYF